MKEVILYLLSVLGALFVVSLIWVGIVELGIYFGIAPIFTKLGMFIILLIALGYMKHKEI